ncbi:MAG: caspase family protein [Bacteroidales bacterium]
MQKNLLISVLIFCNSMLSVAQIISPYIFIKEIQTKKDRIEITYGFENCNPKDKYSVWMEAYTSDGNKLRTNSFLDEYKDISPSSAEKLVWLYARDSLIIDEKIYFKLYAAKQVQVNPGKAYFYSTLFPGSGYKAVGGKNKIYLGIIGYTGLGSSLMFNMMSANSYDKYKGEPDVEESEKLLANSRTYRTLSITSFGIGITTWLIDYYLLSNKIRKEKSKKIEELKFEIDAKDILEVQSEQRYISTRGLPPNLFVELYFSDANGNRIIEANENAELTILISNLGKGDAYNLNFHILDDKGDINLKIVDPKEIKVLKPNEIKQITVPISANYFIKTSEHKLQINVTEKYGYDLDPAYLILQSIESLPSKLNFSGIEILDAGEGTSSIIEDGQLQAGEMVKAKIIIQNTGEGVATNATYEISSNDKNIFLQESIGNLGTINPGEIKEFYVTISPNKRVNTKGNLPLILDLKEQYNIGNLTSFSLPIKLNQKPSKANIVNLNNESEKIISNVARFEYNSKKFFASKDNIMNIRSVVPSNTRRKNSVAVVFGVRDYENMAPAPYADNDATIMKEYFEKVLGIEQVLIFKNEEVTAARLNKVFNPGYGELSKAIIKDSTEVFVFFSGHGIPDKTGENTYLLPYDGIIQDLETFGYNTYKLYDNLSKLGAKNVTVILDACFSGNSRTSEKQKVENLISQKGVIIKAKKPWVNNKDFFMINSSTGSETSLGFDQTETGLFTYYFCAGLQGRADENDDKKITVGELKKYVTSKVTDESRKIFGIQTPEFNGEEDRVMVEYEN